MIVLYSIIMTILSFIFKRPSVKTILSRFQKQKGRCILFFCSSAGEYEQARPLIDLFEKTHDVFVFFFSQSGTAFIQARGDKTPHSLTPPDTLWHWQAVFSQLKPEMSVVVRHELWPGFLHVARKHSHLWLINYSDTKRPNALKTQLLKYFSNIACIHAQAAQTLNLPDGIQVHITGDTKADRVFNRVSSSQQQPLPPYYADKSYKHVIVGSAWPKDAEVVTAAFCQLPKDHKWRLTICPHDIRSDSIANMRALLEQHELSSHEVMIIDKLGVLADLYQFAAAAFIGGAMHHKVHNVLEPAAHGCALAFGPLYKNSPEATHFVAERCATIVESVEDCVNWLLKIGRTGSGPNETVIRAARKLTGGTRNLYDLLFRDIDVK